MPYTRTACAGRTAILRIFISTEGAFCHTPGYTVGGDVLDAPSFYLHDTYGEPFHLNGVFVEKSKVFSVKGRR